MRSPRELLAHAAAAAREPIDGASLAVHRVLLGVVLAVSGARFIANDWVERLVLEPTFRFKYWGFSWVEPLPPGGMRAAYFATIALSVLFALGVFQRAVALTLFALFTYLELVDLTNYLNHYYLVSLLLLLHAAVASNATLSLDALRRGASRAVPRGALWLLRLQVGIVYVFAALAKVETDWLLHAQPLSIWFSARTDWPLIGPLLHLPGVALAASWAGFLNDLLAPFLLSHRKTRWFGFAMVAVFHGLTHWLFNIGIFPVLMIANATLFFEPDWPRRALRLPVPALEAARAPNRITVGLAGVYIAVQLLLPLRAHLYPGSVLWHEQGMRFSWRVMLREKHGAISYRVRARELSRERVVVPNDYLTPRQEQEMGSQPDLILQLAHHIARDLERRGLHDVEVRVDALVSLNGRPAIPMIDPEVDLARIPDGLAPYDFVTDAPTGPPLRLSPSRTLAVAASPRP